MSERRYPVVGLSRGIRAPGMGYEDIKKAEVYAKEGKYLQAAQVLNQAQETAEDVEMYEPFGTVRIRFEGEREIADYKENWILRRQLPGDISKSREIV